MKKLLSLSAVILSFLSFSACSGNAKKDDQKTPPQAGTAPAVTSQNQPLSADSYLDDQLFSGALSENDLEKCKSIKDEKKKAECLKIVQAGTVSKDASDKKDKTLCKKIELERYKENCEKAIDESLADDNKKETYLKSIDNEMALNDGIIAKNDIKGCESLKFKNIRENCEFKISLYQAALNKNLKYCEQVTNKELSQYCKDSLK